MDAIIMNELHKIELEHDVKILYACEAGSRAWGFPTKDSDYDVRFIYIHKTDVYLTIDPFGTGKRRDVIEGPVNEFLDISGWDITKALRLFRKSNPSLLEWMHSTIVYKIESTLIDKMCQMEKDLFDAKACLHHYVNIANKNYRNHLQANTKKYLNILRPILACMWIEKYNQFPSNSFHELLKETIPVGTLRDEMNQLAEIKMLGREDFSSLNIPMINDFIETQIHLLDKSIKSIQVQIPDPTEQLNILFQDSLKEVWRKVD